MYEMIINETKYQNKTYDNASSMKGLKKGQIFGEISVLYGCNRTQTI